MFSNYIYISTIYIYITCVVKIKILYIYIYNGLFYTPRRLYWPGFCDLFGPHMVFSMNVDVTTEVEKDIPSMVSGCWWFPKQGYLKSSKSMIWRNSTHDYSIYIYMGLKTVHGYSKSSKILRSRIFGVPILGNLHIYYTMFLPAGVKPRV